MGAVLVVLVPPLAAAAACGVAVFRDRRGTCHPCGRWPLRHAAPGDSTPPPSGTVVG